MATTTYIDACRRALGDAMTADDSVWALGEDLGRGGVFGQYAGLQDRFGSRRVVDAPISEAAIMGTALGAAMQGTRPVVEMRFADFGLCAVDELVNQLAKARSRCGGQTRVPIVVREPVGMWRASAAQHSQSLEAWYAHIPGLVVAMPATPADAYGLLRAAVECDDPVVLMEHKGLWPLEGELDEAPAPAVLGEAARLVEGEDITILGWSAAVHECVRAAALLQAQGVSAEVLDLRTLWPWDEARVVESVVRTRRLLIVHEAVRTGGFGAEIAATVGERLFGTLRAPVQRLGAPRAPVPYAPPLEALLKVSADDIAATALEMTR